MDLINFIKNLFKQKEDNLWVDPKSNIKSSITNTKSDNHILEINTLTGEVIIKGNTKETYSREYWFPEK
jgi:hypothetical protein